MSITKNTLLIILGSIIGFLFCQLFHSQVKVEIPSTKNSSNQIEKQIKHTELVYTQKEDAIENTNKNLNEHLRSANKQLLQLQKRNIQSQTQIADIINSKQRDTAAIVQTCDSLKNRVIQFIQTYNLKDSIYDETLYNLTQQNNNKDSLLIWQKEQNAIYKNSIQQCLLNTNLINNQLLSLQKQNKKQSHKRIIKVGASIIATIFIANKLR